MANPSGFIDYARQEVGHRPVAERIRDHGQVDTLLERSALVKQAARCMDC